jgi:hypothetical protein
LVTDLLQYISVAKLVAAKEHERQPLKDYSQQQSQTNDESRADATAAQEFKYHQEQADTCQQYCRRSAHTSRLFRLSETIIIDMAHAFLLARVKEAIESNSAIDPLVVGKLNKVA